MDASDTLGTAGTDKGDCGTGAEVCGVDDGCGMGVGGTLSSHSDFARILAIVAYAQVSYLLTNALRSVQEPLLRRRSHEAAASLHGSSTGDGGGVGWAGLGGGGVVGRGGVMVGGGFFSVHCATALCLAFAASGHLGYFFR